LSNSTTAPLVITSIPFLFDVLLSCIFLTNRMEIRLFLEIFFLVLVYSCFSLRHSLPMQSQLNRHANLLLFSDTSLFNTIAAGHSFD
jgi:hypothetical protein